MLEIRFGRFLELKNSLLKSNTGASEIVRWKQSVEVADCFCTLFVQNENSAYWIDLIARNAFSTTAVPTLPHDHCAFTLAIVGPSYGSAEAIMDEELEANEYRSRINSPQTDYAPELLSQLGSSMQYSEEEMDEVFGSLNSLFSR
ncbi:hypothetical protein C2G38_2043406 [Gigaspora rosea]|uniref:Uncharacterized protein n=1 Tax=Gigaspora rosea TaxID=44941 RepID=A0A397UKA5_9GLOM|nr:hypothetical protein C2G38_2043406 [Gigaspora rosea]